MSLRDQLLKKGLASKKDARRVDREQKKKRRTEKGNQRRKKVVAREEQAAREAEEKAAAEARRVERQAREAARDRYEHALRIRNLILGHRVRNRGEHRFHFRAEDGQTIRSIAVQSGIAAAIARGELAIAWLDHGIRVEYVLVSADGARKLRDADAEESLLHWTPGDPPGPDEQPLTRTWETSLRPHRHSAPR